MIKVLGGAAAAVSAMPSLSNETRAASSSKSMFGKAKGNRVVVCGGGWGGISAARSVKEANPKAEVILVEKNQVFSSCPMSNLYLGGLMPLYFSDYTALGRKGIHMVQSVISGIDRGNRAVMTSVGDIEYDFLVLSPGIDYMWESVQGLKEAKNHIPINCQQTLNLLHFFCLNALCCGKKVFLFGFHML